MADTGDFGEVGFDPGNPNSDPPVAVSVLACAYNEERNLPYFLNRVLRERGPSFVLKEVVVVASGCTDSTNAILENFAQLDRRVIPIIQPTRSGKVSALLQGFARTTGEVVIMENPDTVPGGSSFNSLIGCFKDPEVDLVTSRPIPLPRARNLANRLGVILWALHDEVSKISPKPGEAYAIRRVRAPFGGPGFEDDDALLSIALRSGALKGVYCRDARIYLTPPTHLGEFLRQRLRCNRQMVRAARSTRTRHGTWSPSVIVQASVNLVRADPSCVRSLGVFWFLEIFLRAEGLLLSTFSKASQRLWEPIDSTKEAISSNPEPADT